MPPSNVGRTPSTFFGFAQVLKGLSKRMPLVVMLENVPGLINSNQGQDFAAVATTLAERGHWLDAFVLDAGYFGGRGRELKAEGGSSPWRGAPVVQGVRGKGRKGNEGQGHVDGINFRYGAWHRESFPAPIANGSAAPEGSLSPRRGAGIE
jgi:hypothetical protein